MTSESEVLVAARIEANRAFAAHTPPARNAIWWAMVIALIAIATISAAFVYSYFYLRLGADSWPPPGTDLRSWELPLVALVAALVAGFVGLNADRPRVLLVVAAAIGGVALGAQLFALVDSGHAIDANAYEALVITIEGIAALLLATAIALRIAAIAFYRPPARPDGLHDADAALWPGAIGLWSILWLIVHVAPRLI